MNFPTSKASAAASPAAANEPAAKLGKPAGGSEFGALLRKRHEDYARVIRDSHIKAE